MILELEYALSSGSLPPLQSCVANIVVEEHAEVIHSSLQNVRLTVEVDDWGMVKILAVNNYEVINE